ncbi:YjjG family noncanonical pyrimidine nucleotidase [Flavobacterium sp.]|uniref:YjjG family noncanonical pyrimidine nucleotidase n=1 Tax=Flavobacterium sp. TaxID=239 RepID=UPI001B5724DE|nr:YjjG family noncanonical pyrimidine nucleotidase [Flavobacterium sp.]MBP6127191.1 YjjG family noncanonical pyrimidine nucleotidase [Flavobacterium sp.]
MEAIKHIFFDLDHTLWDFEKNSALAFEKIFQELNFDINSQQFMDIYNPINVAYWKLYEKNEIDQETLRVSRVKDAFEALNYSITLDEINIISNLFIEYLTSNNHLIEGTIETLDYLKDKYILHIITNGFSFVQDVKLQKSNLDKYFVTITNSEAAGHKKPHENIFNHALTIANASKNESIMIGDSIEADVLGAMNFGIKAVFFNPANEMVSNNEILQIQSLTQLKNIL